MTSTMPRRRALALAGTALLSWSPAIRAIAGDRPDPAQEATAFVREFADRAIAMLTDRRLSDADRDEKLRELLRTGFDLDITSRLVLGRYWHLATTEQRTAYRRLFEDYLVATYGSQLRKYSGQTLEIQGARLESGRDAIVGSRVQAPNGGAPISVDWRLRRSENRWRIIDVVVAGVSLAITHRSEFASLISREGGIDGLLRALRRKIGSGQVARNPDATEGRA